MRPMLATKGTHVPPRREWVHEVKWDGVRVLADVTRAAGCGCYSRNENDVTVAWPELNRGPLGDRDLLVDGEVIALNERGLPDFRVLQDRMHVRNAAAPPGWRDRLPGDATWSSTCCASTARTSPASRWGSAARVLEGLGLEHSTWQVPGGVRRRRRCSSTRPCSRGSRAIVSKRRTSRYVFGEPHQALAEVRAPRTALVRGRRLAAAGGHRRPASAALLVGEPTGEGLLYRGRVGSGIGGKASTAADRLLADRWPATTARSTTRSRRSTPAAPSGSSRCSSSRSDSHGDRAQPAAPPAVLPRRPHRPRAGGPAPMRSPS